MNERTTLKAADNGHLIIGGCDALELAKEFGVGCVLVESDLTVTVATGDREFKS